MKIVLLFLALCAFVAVEGQFRRRTIAQICRIVEERKACEKIVQLRNGTFCDEAIAKEIYKESDACKEERLPRKERIYTLACCCCEKK
ncbi:unnamed protein product [Cyprideis torosa]|uniref:Uncharacterized protein n=1 Tax=Cyprideis torosa TaxID=163714 RepID=A0A7R8ZYM0_9CRUS|nr:unnamed protein product [Cyprideis torosa]CAG0908723.1 unnamed protein product [Cyprideis torosa]